MRDRTPCCLIPQTRCGTRWKELCEWTVKVTGRGFRTVDLHGDEQGRTPFFAQPVGYDGRIFYVAGDKGCDTEKLLHEACHFLVSPKERRSMVNYGLGPGPFRPVDDLISDNEEVVVSLLQMKIAPCFGLPDDKMVRPDYNVANRRHLDWNDCFARADELYAKVVESIPANVRGLARPDAGNDAASSGRKNRRR